MSGFENNLIQIIDNYYSVLYVNERDIAQYLNSDTTLIYISEKLENDNEIIRCSNLASNVIVVSKKYLKISQKKIDFYKNVNSRLEKNLNDNIVLFIELNDNYSNARYIVKNLIKLFKIIPEIRERFINLNSDITLFMIIKDNHSKFLGDIKNSLKAILIKDVYIRNEFIYDTVCDYLDSKFKGCNVCDFKDDKCAANRAGRINHSIMGCCHSFEYAKFYEFGVLKNVKLCEHMKDRHCTTKNISCKLYTCRYITKQHKEFKFNTRRILLLDCFFNMKQHDVLRYNYFKTREEILEKLKKRNYDIYLWYLYRRKYMAK